MQDKRNRMEERLADIGRRIDSAIAEAERSDSFAKVKEELGEWRVWMDESRVQSALARMEARDLLATLSNALERLSTRLDAGLKDLKEEMEPVSDDLTAAVQEEVDKDPDTTKI